MRGNKYLAPALSFLPLEAKVKAILETLGDNLAAPGPEVKFFKISRVEVAALNDIVNKGGERQVEKKIRNWKVSTRDLLFVGCHNYRFDWPLFFLFDRCVR